MPLPICANRSMSGIRRTSSSDTYTAIVECFHNISDGEIDRVEFSISVNSGSESVTTVSTRAYWVPDDTDFADPLAGVNGACAPIWGYGVTLSMADYSAGYIEIVPTVYAGSGESVTLPTITVHNDKGGADTRPTSKVIYWDWIGGNDSNNGLTLGAPVKTFQKACIEVATANDCGGGTIYIAATGEHTLQSSNSYSFGANLFTSNLWWLTVTKDPSLSREDVAITTPSTFDGDWMTFAGDGVTSSNANIKFSDIKIIPGVVFSSSSIITANTWLEHCLIEPAADYFTTSSTLSIAAYDYRGSPTSVSAQGPVGTRYATSCTSRHCIFPGIGNWVRGWSADEVAGPIIQINADDEAYTNVLLTNVRGNDVSGYFASQTGTIRIENEAGDVFRIQATDNYTGPDFAVYGTALGSAQQFGVNTAGFSNSTNNATHAVISGGYSGSYPYLAITGYGGTPVVEGEASVTMQPAALSDDEAWEIKVHSDIVQFNVNDTSNTILSNIAVFSGWQSQGIFSAGHPISGVAIFNVYDGFVSEDYSLPTRTYTVDQPTKHFLVRNCSLTQVQIDASQANEDVEWVDNIFNSWGTYAGSMSTYTGQGYIDYNHFGTAGQETGGNTTTGLYFNDLTPSLSVDATVSASSYAYGSASSLWSKPTVWNSTNSKGALDNIATANWFLTPVTEVTVSSPLLSLNIANSASVSNDITADPLTSTSSLPSAGFSIYSGLTSPPVINIGSSELTGVSCIVILDGDETPTIYTSASDSSVSITAGQSAINTPGSKRISVSVSQPSQVNVVKRPVDRPRAFSVEKPVYQLLNPTAVRSIEAVSPIKDNEVLPILLELNSVSNNISRTSINSKAVWSQNILSSIDSATTSRTIIKISNANYAKLSSKSDNISGKITPNRQRF
jgi:hypothetical protein